MFTSAKFIARNLNERKIYELSEGVLKILNSEDLNTFLSKG